MDLRLTLTGHDRDVDVLLVAPAGTPLGDVADQLTAAVGEPPDASLSVAGRLLRTADPLGITPLLDGARVEIGVGGTVPPPAGPRQLRVVGGPDAGAVHTLPAGQVTLGRGHEADLRLVDTQLSRRHAVFMVGPEGVRVRDAGSTNGTLLDGVDVGPAAVPLVPGAMLRCGRSLVSYTEPTEPPATVRPDGVGGLGLYRPPRLRPRQAATTVVFPAPVGERSRLRFPWVMVLAPLVLGAVLWSMTDVHSGYLLFMLLSPAMYLANAVSDRFTGGRDRKRDATRYRESLAQARAALDAGLVAETRRRREAVPDPAALALRAAGPGAQLWERRWDDDDALLLRIGSADRPAELTVKGPDPDDGGRPPRRRWWRRKVTEVPEDPGERHPVVSSVPVTVSLNDVGVLGVAGPEPVRDALGRWLAAQLAVLHPPRDLRIVLLTAGGDPDRWRWLRWLPHTGGTPDHAAGTLVGLNPRQVAGRVAELVGVLQARQKATRSGDDSGVDDRTTGGPAGPRYTLLLDHADRLRSVPGLTRLLAEGPAVGIHAICLAADPLSLPEECRATVTLPDVTGSDVRLAVSGEPPVTDLIADLVRPAWADTLARALAPLRDTTPASESDQLPDNARFLDLVGGAGSDPVALAAAWQAQPRSTTTVLGIGMDGAVTVDLSRDGPHALVAGTTGSGKSELLQTLIAGLALRNRPDELAFILVDYKGGAAFADCARLPHTVGMVTDLDARLTSRALESLRAELRRREHQLATVGAKDIEAYLEHRDRACAATAAVADVDADAGTGPHDPPAGPPGPGRPTPGPDSATTSPGSDVPALPRLVIVIDEFASLVTELPDFVPGLVDIARRGRSLGVHLVLATQRPSGVVSAEIRANTALRLCLRVTDAAESADVLDTTAAARIPRHAPGRAYARLSDGRLTAVQTARVGGRPPRDDIPSLRVTPTPWRLAGEPAGPPAVDATDQPTDLATLVATVSAAADLAGVPAPASPWLPPLPSQILLDSIHALDDDRVPLGLHDLPAQQRRAPYVLDLATGGHVMVLGGPRSGRTSALRTVAVAVAARFAADEAHLYVLDCGGGLACLATLPHCGAVVPRGDTALGERLLTRLLGEVTRRQEVLARAGLGSVAEQRGAARQRLVGGVDVAGAGRAPEVGDGPLPWMVLLLDSYESFCQAYEGIDHGRLLDDLGRLVREGPAAGLRVVLTGERQLVNARLASSVSERLVLQMSDTDSYSVAGITPRDVPERPPAGRALVPGEPVTEVQLALLDADPSGPSQVAAVHRVAAECTPPTRSTPLRLRPLPTCVSATDLTGPPDRALWVAVGLGGDDAGPVGFDLAEEGPGALVAGPPGSGRSTALVTMARWLAGRGTPVALVADRRSPLRRLCGDPGIVGVFGPDDATDVADLLADHAGRPLVAVVDDADQLAGASVDNVLTDLLTTGDDRWGVIASGTLDGLNATYHGHTVTLRRSRCGVLLCPARLGDGALLGVRVTGGLPARPGSGLLAVRGTAIPVQVAR